jgi:hypothetical protein
MKLTLGALNLVNQFGWTCELYIQVPFGELIGILKLIDYSIVGSKECGTHIHMVG